MIATDALDNHGERSSEEEDSEERETDERETWSDFCLGGWSQAVKVSQGRSRDYLQLPGDLIANLEG
ncbi:hypothetical protein NEUTE2DRAFT_133288 [Neurospora tetrasperma FGSC 2509]|nr:hypothetical protein NEUTE2DRAFT_133288 [Neurospora tetrasperma FGSC 2509]